MELTRYDNIILADIASYNNKGRSTGHYFSVSDNYLQMFPGIKIAGGPIYESHIGKEDLIRLPYDDIKGTNRILAKWRELKNLKSLLRVCGGKSVVFQQAATSTLIFWLAFVKKPTCCLFLICYDDNSLRSWNKRLAYYFAKRKIDGVICPNDAIGKAFNLPYCTVPDYIYTEKTNNTKSEEQKVYDFCLVGRMSPEKGAEEIIKVFRDTRFRLVIAGRPPYKEMEIKLAEAAKDAENIELHLGFIQEEDYKKYIQRSRYAILNYQGEYSLRSSGVVYDMLFADVPVIGKRCTALQFVEDYGCGFLFDSLEDILHDKGNKLGMYGEYIKGIERYKQSQTVYITKLYDFICSESK